VTRRRGVEYDVVKGRGRLVIAEQLRELVERCNFHCASARELLLDAPDRGVGKNSTIGADQSFAVRASGSFGIDVQRKEPVDIHDGSRRIAQRRPEDFVQVGRRIGTHEQDPPTPRRKADRRSAGHRRLSDTSLSGKEEVSRCAVDEIHDIPLSSSSSRPWGRSLRWGRNSR